MSYNIQTAWLSTAGSQIFLMQLGFLLYESGFVQKVWTNSIIIKNVEDTFVGILTFLFLTYPFASSSESWLGIISKPQNLLFIDMNPIKYQEIFVGAVFATTSLTIISGGVLNRITNIGYISYLFLTMLITYSFISHWIWHPDGWLNALGFVDCAGSMVVHALGGGAAMIAMHSLGPTYGSFDEKSRKLKKIPNASQPLVVIMGTLILWYGWFAFNVASPIAANIEIDDSDLSIISLNTIVAPCSAAVSCVIIMQMNHKYQNFENLTSAIISGLVAITASCYTTNVFGAFVIGFFSSFVLFLTSFVVRYKLHVDDPLNVIAIHFANGCYGCIMEGVFANNAVNEPGLIYSGYKHFGVQLMGTAVSALSILLLSLVVWSIINKFVAIKVSILSTYFGESIFKLDTSLAISEMIECKTELSASLLHQFHLFCKRSYCEEHLAFMIYVNRLKNNYQLKQKDQIAMIHHIVRNFIVENSAQAINVSYGVRCRVLQRPKHEVDIHLFDDCYKEVTQLMVKPCGDFLTEHFKNETRVDGQWDTTIKQSSDNLPFEFIDSIDLTWKRNKQTVERELEVVQEKELDVV
eukprot:809310_1